ncbi:beta-galactosidase [Microbacterium sp. RURRCA19A]|uniref:beta-galactosidase n=1 Tax=Microbacterium sp. RURRCA19A TaxID=1907391 RepID=UPI00095596A5|nr:beta-galactosidase [Microbacterium sp. RURRCA19A]SIS11104.1 beta-galactosidase [Microbacterium sp. RURRCA19A]
MNPDAPRPDRTWPRDRVGLRYGGDYNPEQWDAVTRREDIELMKAARVNLVSVGIFSWGLIEPREGEFDFAVLDETMDALAEAGIGVNLATPTASPPAWFFRTYPDAWPVTRDGRRLGFGSRGMASPNSPHYRGAIVRIASALAERYATHPALAMWHVHNEYGNPIPASYDDHSVAAFRVWLQHRYGSLDGVNRAWGTAFWGQRYHEWEEIDAPRLAATTTNPSQRLDFARFSSESLLDCFRAERDAIRAHTPDLPVTTNFMASTEVSMDLWRWAPEVDVVATDHYLQAERDDRHILLSMDADLTRSLGDGRPWMLMEHSTSAVNWQPRNLAKLPGELARNSIAHLGRGADAIMFFQFRASRAGAEKFHSAMLPHAGTGTRVWREVLALGESLESLSEIQGSRVRSDVAIVWDWEAAWAQGLEWRPSEDVRSYDRTVDAYASLWRHGVETDFVHPEADLSAYRVVILPGIHLLSARAAAGIQAFVARGGVALVEFGTAAVDENDHVHPGGFLAPLREVLGVGVDEYLPFAAGERHPLTGGGEGRLWAEDLVLDVAEVRETFAAGRAASRPALTRHRYGEGSAWYLATSPDAPTRDRMLRDVLADAGLVVDALPEGLERVDRWSDDARYRTLVNHGTADVVLAVESGSSDVVTGEPCGAELVVPAGAWRVIRTPRASLEGKRP